ncbi:hypothetical protein [Methanimicrococcus blatticola]|uniref:hypothetical protein n=1 Tax=Methanimicrococcus blatticola TaxID=91560 RepID=UPI00105D3637|nr:hypothetical protein [Methanimicrococcus blatticola]
MLRASAPSYHTRSLARTERRYRTVSVLLLPNCFCSAATELFLFCCYRTVSVLLLPNCFCSAAIELFLFWQNNKNKK